MRAVQVVSIVGFPHSGSTLLGDVLASAPGVVHAGELAMLFRLWARGVDVCSCGARNDACSVWGPAVQDALARHDTTIDVVATALVDPPAPWLVPLVRDVTAAAGAGTVIDSSNWPWFGRLLGDAFDDVAYVHLVRDPRAAVHSRLRKGRTRKLAGRSAARQLVSIARDARRWVAWNADAASLAARAPLSTVRYEDLVADPAPTLARVTSELGLPAPAVDGRRVERARQHVVWGNRRARAGAVELVLDDAWRRDASPVERAVVSALTVTGRRRHRY